MSEVLNEDIDQLGSNRTDIITTTLKCTNLLRSWVSLEKVTFWNKNDSLMKILLCVCPIGFVGGFFKFMEHKQIIFPEVTVESNMYYDTVLVILFICIVK